MLQNIKLRINISLVLLQFALFDLMDYRMQHRFIGFMERLRTLHSAMNHYKVKHLQLLGLLEIADTST